VTLEEVDRGCTKEVTIKTQVFILGRGPFEVDKLFTIEVKPGWKAGTKVTHPKAGDQKVGRIPADIVFIIRDEPHPVFVRDGSDLRYTHKISIADVSNSIRLHLG
jgi:DnaJ-class molecular chaperone